MRRKRQLPQKFTPVLMFVGNVCGKAEEAIKFYVSVFRNAPDGAKTGETKAKVLARYGKNEEPDKEGTVRYAHFSLLGQEFGAMDSARDHKFAFNEAISFIVPCESQEEIDYFWEKLSADPKAEQCGWLKDKYGLSWQITPAIMQELLSGNDKKRIGAGNPGVPQNEEVRYRRAQAGSRGVGIVSCVWPLLRCALHHRQHIPNRFDPPDAGASLHNECGPHFSVPDLITRVRNCYISAEKPNCFDGKGSFPGFPGRAREHATHQSLSASAPLTR